MSFFEDLGKKLNFALGEASAKTKELAGVAKLNTSISARQHEIDEAYLEIGRALFEREAADADSPVAALCAKILANQEAINTMKQQITELKNETVEGRKARSESIFGKEESAEEAAPAEEAVQAVEEAAPSDEAVQAAEEAAPAEEVTQAAEEVAEEVAPSDENA